MLCVNEQWQKAVEKSQTENKLLWYEVKRELVRLEKTNVWRSVGWDIVAETGEGWRTQRVGRRVGWERAASGENSNAPHDSAKPISSDNTPRVQFFFVVLVVTAGQQDVTHPLLSERGKQAQMLPSHEEAAELPSHGILCEASLRGNRPKDVPQAQWVPNKKKHKNKKERKNNTKTKANSVTYGFSQ